jgi:nucleotide-binding universal stress UspA family protein
MKIMIATDGSEASIEAARRGIALLGDQPHTDVTLLTVVPPAIEPLMDSTGFAGPVVTPTEVEEIQRSNDERAHIALAATDAALTERGEHTHQEIVMGTDVGHAVVRAAEREGADVIVMGASTRGWFRRLFEGPTVHYVIEHAPCPVLTVPLHHD